MNEEVCGVDFHLIDAVEDFPGHRWLVAPSGVGSPEACKEGDLFTRGGLVGEVVSLLVDPAGGLNPLVEDSHHGAEQFDVTSAIQDEEEVGTEGVLARLGAHHVEARLENLQTLDQQLGQLCIKMGENREFCRG